MGSHHESNRTVVVIGAGPRGTSVLERLAANVDVPSDLSVHIVDPHLPGPGSTWRVTQHAALLMNTTAETATVFTDVTVPMDGPVLPGPSLFEWLGMPESRPWLIDEELRREASATEARTSPSRRLHGAYLGWAFEHIAGELRARGGTVEHHAATATAIDADAAGRQQVRLSNGESITADAVLLCLGHIAPPRPASPSARPVVIAPGNIDDQETDLLRPRMPVVVRGLGLGFYDLLAVLTHGRGGRYSRDAAGVLHYVPSGREPLLWAGSRRGFPFRGKPRLTAKPPWAHPAPSRPTLDALARRRGDLSFAADLWPRIAASSIAAYLDTDDRRGELFDQALSALESPVEVSALVAKLHRLDPDAAYDPQTTGDPLRGRVFGDEGALQVEMIRLLQADLAESARGEHSAVKAADTAIGHSRGWVGPLAAAGGLRASSQRTDYDGWFDSYANSIAGGPPADRVEQAVAVARSGILTFLGAGLEVQRVGGEIVARSVSVPHTSIHAAALIDAYLPDFHVARTTDPLLTDQRRSGAIRPFAVATDGDSYEPGGVDVDVEHRLIDIDGHPHRARFALGVPVGRWGNASYTAMAGTASPFLAQTDAAARGALRAAFGVRQAEDAA
jgi:hypothetical protein